MGPEPFAARLARDGVALARARLDTVQINVGKLCNQVCRHCHVDAGPRRSEVMDWDTAEAALGLAIRAGAGTLDVTGGAPELNPGFRRIGETARRQGLELIVRHNLTVQEEPGQADLPELFAAWGARVVASLPCYLEENVDAQRGRGVHKKSLAALRRLNAVGYGRGRGLVLDLVYNPGGPDLPPPQEALEADYKRELAARYGIVFDRLLTLTNMPIARFAEDLRRLGAWDTYLGTLADAHNPAAVAKLMCRELVSVSWDGWLYDCDFNQMLAMRLEDGGEPLHVARVRPEDLVGRRIAVGEHCYGCTAGAGSSCGGQLV